MRTRVRWPRVSCLLRHMCARAWKTCHQSSSYTTQLLFFLSAHETLKKLRVSFLTFLVCCAVDTIIFGLNSTVSFVGRLPRAKNIRSAKGSVNWRVAQKLGLIIGPGDTFLELLRLTTLPTFQPISEQGDCVARLLVCNLLLCNGLLFSRITRKRVWLVTQACPSPKKCKNGSAYGARL